MPEWLKHRNGALGFAGITYAARDPLPLLTRLRRLFGDEAVRQTALGHEVSTGKGTISVVLPGAWARELGVAGEPDIGEDAAACIGIDIRVADRAILERVLRDGAVKAVAAPGGIAVPAFEDFGNVLLHFVD